MNTALSSHADSQRLSWWALVGRWLLFLLVAFDLVSSPFHAHSHDAGGGDAFHWEQVDVDDHDEAHIEAPHGKHFSHSLMALWSAEMPRVAEPALADVSTKVPTDVLVASVLLGLAGLLGAEARRPRTRWRASPEHIPIPSGVHWRPIGRAPPSLHT